MSKFNRIKKQTHSGHERALSRMTNWQWNQCMKFVRSSQKQLKALRVQDIPLELILKHTTLKKESTHEKTTD